MTTSAFAGESPVPVEAKTHFKAGIAYLEEPTGAKYEEAYSEFHAAYAIWPSYKILNNIALCALFLERDGESIDDYEKYLAAAPKGEIAPAKRIQLESDLQRLKAGVVSLSFSTVPANVTIVDERISTQGPKFINRYRGTNGEVKIGVHPGVHRVTVTAEGFQPQTWEFDALSASSFAREFKLVPIATPTTPQAPISSPVSDTGKKVKGVPNLVYAGVAFTGAFTVATVITGAIVLSKKHELVDLNKTGDDPQKARGIHDDAKRFALISDLSLGAAFLAAGATAYFYFSAPNGPEPVAPKQSGVSVLPAVGYNEAGLAVQGRF